MSKESRYSIVAITGVGILLPAAMPDHAKAQTASSVYGSTFDLNCQSFSPSPGDCGTFNTEFAANPDLVGLAVGGEEMSAELSDNVISSSKQSTQTFLNRLRLARGGAQFTFNGGLASKNPVQIAQDLAQSNDGTSSGSAGLGGRLGAFLNLNYNTGEQDADTLEPGFDYDGGGVLAGVDYRVRDDFIAGLGLGYKRLSSEFKGLSSGELDADTFSVTLYASYYPIDAVYVDAVLSYGFTSFDTERNIVFPGINQKATGDTDGDQFSASIGGGYQLTHNALSYGPTVQLNYLTATADGYTETGAGIFNIIAPEQDIDSFTSVLGFRADYAFSTSFGIISPSARVEWEHEFSNDSRIVSGQFASNPGTFANLPTKDPDRDYFNLGIGVAATLPQGITAFADYEVLLGYEDLDHHSVTVGARMEF